MSASKRPWRRVLVGAVIASFAVAPASAPAAKAQKLSPKAKKAIRAQLRKTVKKNPGVVRRKSFLRKAALVNFKLPVTIRLRNPCTTENGQNPAPNASPLVLVPGLPHAGHRAQRAHDPVGDRQPRSVARHASGRGRRLARRGRRVPGHL